MNPITGLVVGAVVTATVLSPVTIAVAAPPTHPLSAPQTLTVRASPDLDTAEARAERLHAQLDQLRDRLEWTEERLAYARDQMAAATSNSIVADQQLATLQGASTAADIDLAHRVRAIEQSGGAAALYSQALDADAITDVTSNVAALQAVLGTDVMRLSDAQASRDAMAEVRAHLDHIADQRAHWVTQARELAEQARELTAQQRQLVENADARVAAITERLEREAAAAAAATIPWNGAVPEGPTPYSSPAIAAALSVLGSPYVWGDEGPDTFDCSGLVQWSYLQAGLVLPRLASDQYFASTPVPVDQMQPGDLLVYAYDVNDPDTIHHITMYIGNGQMVHAPHTGDVVRIAPVYYDGLYGVGRPGL